MASKTLFPKWKSNLIKVPRRIHLTPEPRVTKRACKSFNSTKHFFILESRKKIAGWAPNCMGPEMPKAEFPNKFPTSCISLVSAASDSAFGAASHRKLGVVGVMFFRLGYSLTSPLRLKYTKMPNLLEHMIGHLALEKGARQLLKVLTKLSRTHR